MTRFEYIMKDPENARLASHIVAEVCCVRDNKLQMFDSVNGCAGCPYKDEADCTSSIRDYLRTEVNENGKETHQADDQHKDL